MTILKGSFENHVDKILTIFDPLPPLGGQIWTFLTPFSYVQMDLVDIYQPPSPPIHVHVVIERPPMIVDMNVFPQNSQLKGLFINEWLI